MVSILLTAPGGSQQNVDIYQKEEGGILFR